MATTKNAVGETRAAGGSKAAAAKTKTATTAKGAGGRRGRPVPRAFAFHWGSGNIVEEASFTGQYTELAIQLLEYEADAKSFGVRFCYYSLDGRFQRSPMMLDSSDSLEGCGQR
jgi:hypothetical protein